MYVCLCKGITDSQIREAVNGGANSLGQVQRELGAATNCGKCAGLVAEVIDETLGGNMDTGLFFEVA